MVGTLRFAQPMMEDLFIGSATRHADRVVIDVHQVLWRIALTPSLPATNAERLRKGAQRRSNPSLGYAAAWIASLRSQWRGWISRARCELICFARKRNFVLRPATNQHDGQIISDFPKSSQAPESKIFRFRSHPNQSHNAACLAADEGRWPSSRTRGEMRWTLMAR
jgi:hypothetical protein